MWPVEIFEKSFFGKSCNFISSYVFFEEKLIFKTPGLSGRLSRCPAENSGRQFSRGKKNYLFFLGSEWESFGFPAKRIWQSCQNCNPCDQRSLGIKWFFSKQINFESFSWDLAKEFWTRGKSIHKVSQIRNLRVHKNCKRKCGRTRKAFYVSSGTFRGKNFGRKKNFLTPRHWAKKCRFLEKQF